MHHVPFDSQCCACQVACEAESLMHLDNRCVIVQNRWTRDRRARRERDSAHSSIQVVIVGRGCCGHSHGGEQKCQYHYNSPNSQSCSSSSKMLGISITAPLLGALTSAETMWSLGQTNGTRCTVELLVAVSS